jgi:hypothetical protein
VGLAEGWKLGGKVGKDKMDARLTMSGMTEGGMESR